MKNFLSIITLSSILVSCVDNYTDANPPLQLDGPAPFTDLVGDEIVATNTDDDVFTWVPNGGTARIEISIVDAPGLIDSVSSNLSNIQIPDDWGSVTFEGFDAVRGQMTGSFVVVYNAPLLDENDTLFPSAQEDIVISIFDAQDPRKVIDINTLETFRTQYSPGSDCFSNNDLVSFYRSVTSGFDSENGSDYTDLIDTVEVLLETKLESPGYYGLSDGSFGLYEFQGDDEEKISFEVCENNILDASGEFKDSFSGTVNSDGSISISWSNDAGDTGNTVMTPIEAPEE